MLHKKDIWGGTVQSLHVGRKDAEDQLKRELRGDISVNPEKRVDEIQDKKSQRKRKKKSYGTDFEEDDSTSETEVNDGMYILTLVSGGNRAGTGPEQGIGPRKKMEGPIQFLS
ncbi:uncharacterized protein LOC141886909 [Acropora palmata]|uniref:uncharacterized protein LOC141886909 n=1 Tax=Acropora palmata TaxID=6131 RepID=UPI003DA0A45F